MSHADTPIKTNSWSCSVQMSLWGFTSFNKENFTTLRFALNLNLTVFPKMFSSQELGIYLFICVHLFSQLVSLQRKCVREQCSSYVTALLLRPLGSHVYPGHTSQHRENRLLHVLIKNNQPTPSHQVNSK